MDRIIFIFWIFSPIFKLITNKKYLWYIRYLASQAKFICV
ncbi:hypothetical protein PROVRUST_04534 [Providencia rustigianii DSM 4541]|uniref:Uncharacterized protein n=1 Tax=Providencia rustigianii DSM 4541 TaxID=500637 RepID=D1NXA6_9GAMM|nr:hypothetical protein PROVRUST_04534 [Providencia rustigianii DSM 4541]